MDYNDPLISAQYQAWLQLRGQLQQAASLDSDTLHQLLDAHTRLYTVMLDEIMRLRQGLAAVHATYTHLAHHTMMHSRFEQIETRHGFTLYTHPTAPENHELHLHRTYKLDSMNLLQTYLKPGDTYVDVGAGVGFLSIVAARHMQGQGRIIALETQTDNMLALTANVQSVPPIVQITHSLPEQANLIRIRTHHADVLQEAQAMLKQHHPILLLHDVAEPDALLKLLQEASYQPYVYKKWLIPYQTGTDFVCVYQPDNPSGLLLDAKTFAPVKPLSEMNIDFAHPVDGYGWQIPEQHPTYGAFQWTGQTEATLYVPLQPGTDYDVTIEAIAWLTEDIIDSLSLSVNGTPVKIDRIPQESTYLYRGIVPQALINQAMTTFTLHTNRVATPHEIMGAADVRPLGVAVNKFLVKAR